VNEASTIIQSAAHEDANIIFGAVLDEKMKDEVKITVIATGFKELNRRREPPDSAVALQSARAAGASVHATYEVSAMRDPQSAKPAPKAEPAKSAEPETRVPDRPRVVPYVPDNLDDIDSEIVRHAEPVEDFPDPRIAIAEDRQGARQEAKAMDTTSSSVEINYDADDLEIPAFLRKRGEG